MADVPSIVAEEFIEACHAVAARGLVRCSSGNISLRLDDDRLLATSSRSWMETLTAADLCVCRVSDGEVLSGKTPTVEIDFHAGILRERPDINVVMHFQTPFATALGCRNEDVASFFVIPEIPYYIGPVARVPYLLPGSEALADAVVRAMRDHDMVIMSNHGQVTVAQDFTHVIQNAEFFELACSVIVHAGDSLIPLPEDEIRHLLAMRRERREGGT
jgi:ribulose-5-phosphate 4-epimerase/fuculose-1-phosphate aldolase